MSEHPATSALAEHVFACEACKDDTKSIDCAEAWRLTAVLATANEGLSTLNARSLLKVHMSLLEVREVAASLTRKDK